MGFARRQLRLVHLVMWQRQPLGDRERMAMTRFKNEGIEEISAWSATRIRKLDRFSFQDGQAKRILDRMESLLTGCMGI